MRLEMAFTTTDSLTQVLRSEKSTIPSQLLAGQIEATSRPFSSWLFVYWVKISRFRKYSPYIILSIWEIHSAHSPAEIAMPVPRYATTPAGIT